MSIYTQAPAVRIILGALAVIMTSGVCAADETLAPKLNIEAVHAAIAARQTKAANARLHAQAQKESVSITKFTVARGPFGFVNPSRAYPPSCLADGLPVSAASTDPNAQQIALTLAGYNGSGDQTTETDTFTLWRVPCSDGVSATLLEFDRPSGSFASGGYVEFPNSYFPLSSGNVFLQRLSPDPNTVFADMQPYEAVSNDTNVYVLEYYYGDSTADAPDFNQAFSFSIDTLLQNSNGDEIVGTLNMPAYTASTFNYPSATNPLEISGYVSGPWYDPNHGGEGMLIEVYDNGDQATRTFAATWYTFDKLGLPYWLVGQATIPIQGTASGQTNGYQVINAPVVYVSGGGFAGNFTPPVTSNPWGKMSFSFSDCNTLNFSYNGASSGNAPDGPSGSGTRQWSRLANISGLVCQ